MSMTAIADTDLMYDETRVNWEGAEAFGHSGAGPRDLRFDEKDTGSRVTVTITLTDNTPRVSTFEESLGEYVHFRDHIYPTIKDAHDWYTAGGHRYQKWAQRQVANLRSRRVPERAKQQMRERAPELLHLAEMF